MITAVTTEAGITMGRTMIIITTTGAHPHTVDTRIADTMTTVTGMITITAAITVTVTTEMA